MLKCFYFFDYLYFGYKLLLFANNRKKLGGIFGIEKNYNLHYWIRDCIKL